MSATTDKQTSPWAIKVLVAAAIPGIACIGLYGVDFSQDVSGWRAFLSISAYPLLLLAFIGLYLSLSAQPIRRTASWICAGWAAVEVAILVASRW